jgi:hypothetical protein
MGSEKPPFLNRGGADINWNSPIWERSLCFLIKLT